MWMLPKMAKIKKEDIIFSKVVLTELRQITREKTHLDQMYNSYFAYVKHGFRTVSMWNHVIKCEMWRHVHMWKTSEILLLKMFCESIPWSLDYIVPFFITSVFDFVSGLQIDARCLNAGPRSENSSGSNSLMGRSMGSRSAKFSELSSKV